MKRKKVYGGKNYMNQAKTNVNMDDKKDLLKIEDDEKVIIIGQRVKELREAKGWSTAKLAELINKSKATVVHYENSNRYPQMKYAKKIAQVLDTSIDYITGMTDHPTPPLTAKEAQGLAKLIEKYDFHADGTILTDSDLDIVIEKLRGRINKKTQ